MNARQKIEELQNIIEQFYSGSKHSRDIDTAKESLIKEMEGMEGKLKKAVDWIDGFDKEPPFRQPIARLSRVGILEYLTDEPTPPKQPPTEGVK